MNPVTGLQQVVAQVTGGRTGEQSTTYDRAVQLLQEARGAAAKGDRVTTVTKLNRISTEGLSPEDVSSIEAQKKQVLSVLDGQ